MTSSHDNFVVSGRSGAEIVEIVNPSYYLQMFVLGYTDLLAKIIKIVERERDSVYALWESWHASGKEEDKERFDKGHKAHQEYLKCQNKVVAFIQQLDSWPGWPS